MNCGMKIYDEAWNELAAPDLEAGWLEDTQRLVMHHEALPGSPAEYGWEVLEGTETLHPGGLQRQVVTKPAVPACVAWDEYEPCQVYHPYTEEEIAERNKPTFEERIEAQVLYTAMMTDTILDMED